MAITTWAPGMDAVALGPGSAWAIATQTWLYHKEDHTFDLNPGVEERQYERMTRTEVIDQVLTTLTPPLTVNGDADSLELGIHLRAIMSADSHASGTVHTFKLGGALGTAVPLLNGSVVEGAVNLAGGTGASAAIWAQKLKNMRATSLRLFLDQPGGKLKYAANYVGLWDGEAELAAQPSFISTGKNLFSQGGSYHSISGAERKLISFSLEMMNAADPRYTSVQNAAAVQTTPYTIPTGFEEGGVRCTFDITYYADEAPTTLRTQSLANTSSSWVFNFKSGTDILTITLPRAKYRTVNLQKQGRSNQRVNIQGTATFGESDATSVLASLTNVFTDNYDLVLDAN